MKFKKGFMIATACVGVYWIGKIVGAKVGAKSVLNQYADVIADDTHIIKLADNAIVTVTATVKKGK